MPLCAACRAVAPVFACQHADLLLYLAPSVALAVLIRVLAGVHPVFFLFTLAGTLCHELAHYAVGLVTGAAPGALTIVPRRVGRRVGQESGRQRWQLGSVALTRVRWYNAAPAALAPLLTLALPILVARWRTAPGWTFEPLDVAIAFALAPQFLSCWPSAADWRIALRSWPYLVAIAAVAVLLQRHGTLFQFVKP
jgi:hypothetical protein